MRLHRPGTDVIMEPSPDAGFRLPVRPDGVAQKPQNSDSFPGP
jgi:hypothetical protein